MPRYSAGLRPAPILSPMFWVCNRVFTTHSGLVIIIVAAPAPAAAAMWTPGEAAHSGRTRAAMATFSRS